MVREDLRLKNMMGSGTGTVSAPESSAKKELNQARIGAVTRRLERRCVKTRTDTVVVHPGNTSTLVQKGKQRARGRRTAGGAWRFSPGQPPMIAHRLKTTWEDKGPRPDRLPMDISPNR